MSRKAFIASCGLVVGLAAVLSAQVTTSSDSVERKAVHSIRVKVIGCVAKGARADHYRLTRAFPSGDGVRSPVGTAGRSGWGEDLSFENSPAFELIGGRLEGHVGHTVEIVGITSDTKLNNTESFRSTIGSSTREDATLTVRSVKMIAAACP